MNNKTVTEAKVKTALGIGKVSPFRKGAVTPCRRLTSGDDRPRWLGENTRLPGLFMETMKGCMESGNQHEIYLFTFRSFLL